MLRPEPGGGMRRREFLGLSVERQRRDFALSVTGPRCRRVYDMTVTDHIPVQAYHFPFPGFDHIERFGTGFRFEPGT